MKTWMLAVVFALCGSVVFAQAPQGGAPAGDKPAAGDQKDAKADKKAEKKAEKKAKKAKKGKKAKKDEKTEKAAEQPK